MRHRQASAKEPKRFVLKYNMEIATGNACRFTKLVFSRVSQFHKFSYLYFPFEYFTLLGFSLSVHMGATFSSPTRSMSSDLPKADENRNERFHLPTQERLTAVALASGIVGAGVGFFEGIKISSLRFLTENGHRLPTTVGGWYFYHKKKNYVMILSGAREATKIGLRYSAGVSSFFGLEAGIDYARGTKDFLSSAAAATIVAWTYGAWKHMSPVQRMSYVKKGGIMGLGIGIVQDVMIRYRGGHVWYMHLLDDYRTPLSQRI